MEASFSPDGKSMYTLEGMTSAWLKNKLKVNTPTKRVFFLEGNADYVQDKSLKLEGTLDIHRLMRKPTRVQRKKTFFKTILA